MPDDPFHAVFLLYFIVLASIRSYYSGLAATTGEKVYKRDEGIVLLSARYILGIPFMLGVIAYLLNPRWMEWSQVTSLPGIWRWFGLFLLALSILLVYWTHINLNKNFTDTVYIRKNAFLVTTGPYRWVRHPMYVAGLIMGIGSGLALANWFIGLTGTLLMLLIMILRTPIEEEKLLQRHGEAYRQYCEKTGRFFPKI